MEKILIASVIINLWFLIILIINKKVIDELKKDEKTFENTQKLHESLIESLEKEFIKKDIQIFNLHGTIDFLSAQNIVLNEKELNSSHEDFFSEAIHKEHLKMANNKFLQILQTSK